MVGRGTVATICKQIFWGWGNKVHWTNFNRGGVTKVEKMLLIRGTNVDRGTNIDKIFTNRGY